MGSKLLGRVWKVVDKATERAEFDTNLLSSANTKWKVDHGLLKYDERPPATPSLILLKDYREWYFSALLLELRPPKISPDDYVELVDRVEKLSRTGLREPSGDQILALLEKYDVVVPKEVLISLLKDKGQNGGPQKKQYSLTERGRLAAPKAEAPPKWNLSCCKGLHESAAMESRVRYKPSLYYNLSRMHHNDNIRSQVERASAIGKLRGPASPGARSTLTPMTLPSTRPSTRLSTAGSSIGGDHRGNPPPLPTASPDPVGRTILPRTAAGRSRSRPATRASFNTEKRDAPWMSEKAPEPIHLCIDATNNTYTIAEYTPRQTKQTESQKSMHMQRFILNELGSRILMS